MAMQFMKLFVFISLCPNRRVLFDDASLPVGTVRKRDDGGQKGVRSIYSAWAVMNFAHKNRYRKNPIRYDMAAWVLSALQKGSRHYAERNRAAFMFQGDMTAP